MPLVLAGGVLAQQEPTAVSVTTFVVRGHGWGHGLGMPQWGAFGLAKQGSTYDKILAYYYRGTQLGQAPPESVGHPRTSPFWSTDAGSTRRSRASAS